jgi:hypothetical protein
MYLQRKANGTQAEIPSHAWMARAGVLGIVALGFVAMTAIDAVASDRATATARAWKAASTKAAPVPTRVPTQKLMRNPWERPAAKTTLVVPKEEVLYFYW